MDVRVVESVWTTGGLGDPTYRINPAVENVSLDWNETTGKLAVVDTNMNFNLLPWQLYTDCVKKVFLTYNGKECNTGQLIETVVMESGDEDDVNQIPGYNNSNQWEYSPSTFHYPEAMKQMTNITDYLTKPYDYSEGFTVMKTFLTAAGNTTPGTPEYTAWYRAPELATVVPANVEGNRIYTDGWYTSYECLVRTWDSVDPVVNGAGLGVIVYYAPQKKFYINITGNGGQLVQDPNNTTIFMPDTTNWREDPNFDEWQTLMKNNLDTPMVNDSIFFIETQHLVTVELNKAILTELKKQCACCDKPSFSTSSIQDYMKLVQKRLGAWVQFEAENFHEASCILASARPMCVLCLYHGNLMNKPGPSC